MERELFSMISQYFSTNFDRNNKKTQRKIDFFTNEPAVKLNILGRQHISKSTFYLKRKKNSIKYTTANTCQWANETKSPIAICSIYAKQERDERTTPTKKNGKINFIFYCTESNKNGKSHIIG